MRNRIAVVLAVAAVLAVTAVPVLSAPPVDRNLGRPADLPMRYQPTLPPQPTDEFEGLRADTIWLFEANFADPMNPDNQWLCLDQSGTPGEENYWHKDNIRIYRPAGFWLNIGTPLPETTFTHLGDSTWWCGKYDACYRQGLGYGNEWDQYLTREFPLAGWSAAGDGVTFEWDQRFAMEANFDYGYVDVRFDSGGTWSIWHTEVGSATVQAFHNHSPSASNPGYHKDWDHATYGHWTLNLDAYADTDIDIRFRFESDQGYSSYDRADNPPKNSVRDGAWQLDNFDMKVNTVSVWSDDCEAAGDNGWVHDDILPSGNVNVTFARYHYPTEVQTGRDIPCEDRVGYVMAAVDYYGTMQMVDDQDSWMLSPAIDVSGTQTLVCTWDEWIDFPDGAGDYFDWYAANHDTAACMQRLDYYEGTDGFYWYGGPYWTSRVYNFDEFAEKDYFSLAFEEWDQTPVVPPETHRGGLFLNRVSVGYVPSTETPTRFVQSEHWRWKPTWFEGELAEAADDTGYVEISDADGIATCFVEVWDDTLGGVGGYVSYACEPTDNEHSSFNIPPPVAHQYRGNRILFHYVATDSTGDVAYYPGPDTNFWQDILPQHGFNTVDRGVLLVDKHGRYIPGETRRLGIYHTSRYYYDEMLEILGYEYDLYRPWLPSSSVPISNGADSTGMKYYDTQIWIANDFSSATLNPRDQFCLMQWLNEASLAVERDLLCSGSEIGFDLMQSGHETLDFYTVWMASDFIATKIGLWDPDSIPTLQEVSGGWTFMDYDDGKCILSGGCPEPVAMYDVVDPQAGLVPYAEVVAEYVKADLSTKNAGVAYTDQNLFYQTVNLGFPMEDMMDGKHPNGYYKTGIEDRVNLMRNILNYFGAGLPPVTDVPETGTFRNLLSQAYPNPFNPVTVIQYSVKQAGPVSIKVYNAAGRVVATLLESELEPGDNGRVAWDGTNGNGEKCASGVYFYRIDAPGFVQSKKMVMLK